MTENETVSYTHLDVYKRQGLITLEALYIDGTKIEANANRYTFVWRGSINYHLAVLLDTIDAVSYTHLDVYKRQDIGRLVGSYDGLPVVGKGGLTGNDHTACDIVTRLFREAAR